MLPNSTRPVKISLSLKTTARKEAELDCLLTDFNELSGNLFEATAKLEAKVLKIVLQAKRKLNVNKIFSEEFGATWWNLISSN